MVVATAYIDNQSMRTLIKYALREPVKNHAGSKKEYKERINRYTQFQERYHIVLSTKALLRGSCFLTFPMLADFMEVENMTAEQLFSILGTHICELDEDTQVIRQFAETLSEKDRRAFLKYLLNAAPLWWRLERLEDNPPPNRLFNYMNRTRSSRNKGILKNLTRQGLAEGVIIPLPKYPEACDFLGCPLKFALPCLKTIYSSVDLVDEILEVYWFLSDVEKRAIAGAIRERTEKRG